MRKRFSGEYALKLVKASFFQYRCLTVDHDGTFPALVSLEMSSLTLHPALSTSASSVCPMHRRYAPCAAQGFRRCTRCCGSAARGCRTHSYTPRRRRGLLCELPRGIVGIFICDVIILFFRRPVKFVVGILNALPVAIGRQREGSFMDPLNEKIFKNSSEQQKKPLIS